MYRKKSVGPVMASLGEAGALANNGFFQHIDPGKS